MRRAQGASLIAFDVLEMRSTVLRRSVRSETATTLRASTDKFPVLLPPLKSLYDIDDLAAAIEALYVFGA